VYWKGAVLQVNVGRHIVTGLRDVVVLCREEFRLFHLLVWALNF